MKFIVDFKNNLSIEEIENHLQSLNASILKTYSLFDKTYLVESDSHIQFNEDLHSSIIHDDDNPIKLLSTTVYSDQTFGKKTLNGPVLEVSTLEENDWWKNYIIYNPEFEQPTYKIDRHGQGITVYVLDSGCELSHPEFINRPISNLFSFNDDFTDTNGHGTAIASVITGATCGITDATVKCVKIFDKRMPTKQSDLVNALDAIYKDFTENNLNFAVINCSWTITKNEYIESKLQALIDMGIIIVAAAGNSGTSIDDITPACMKSVLTIGSYNSSLVPSDFSNYTGSITSLTSNATNYGELDGWAPGEQIYVAGLNSTYGMTAGTSIAAGIHSAVCAYNLSVATMEYITTNLTNYVEANSLLRKNLLDLSNPIYANSKNSVTTLMDQIIDDENATSTFGMSVRGVSGQHYYANVFNPRKTLKVEILGDLPENTKVTELGIFIGPVKEVSNVTRELVPMTITVLDGQEFSFEFEIISVPSSFVIGTDSTGDPELDLKLQALQCYPTNPCEPLDGCNDNCAPSYNYCQINGEKNCPLGTQCVCVL